MGRKEFHCFLLFNCLISNFIFFLLLFLREPYNFGFVFLGFFFFPACKMSVTQLKVCCPACSQEPVSLRKVGLTCRGISLIFPPPPLARHTYSESFQSHQDCAVISEEEKEEYVWKLACKRLERQVAREQYGIYCLMFFFSLMNRDTKTYF